MRLALAAVVLLAGRLAAQTVDPLEITYGPFNPGPNDHSFSIGTSPGGLLLAWSEIDPGETVATIHVGLLDFGAQLTSPIRTLVPLNPGTHATTPVVATDGSRFLVVWLELDGGTWRPERVAGALLDASGVQLTGTMNLGRAAEGLPSVVWDGLVYRVFGQTSYHISRDGVPAKTPAGGVERRVQFATPVANGWVDWFGGRPRTGPVLIYNLRWSVITANWIRSGEYQEYGFHGGRPTVLAETDDQLIIWAYGRSLLALPVVDGRPQPTERLRHTFGADVADPAAGGSLVVFEAGGDIWGVPVDGLRTFREPFLIASGDERQELPRVYPLGYERYLVTWVTARDAAGIRLAGRFVMLP